MTPAVIEHPFDCPYCGETITMLLEPDAGEQDYIEDCEVCCNPIGIQFRVEDDAVVDFVARPLE
jgi:hypothetical protein